MGNTRHGLTSGITNMQDRQLTWSLLVAMVNQGRNASRRYKKGRTGFCKDLGGNVWEWGGTGTPPGVGAETLDPVGPRQGEFRVYRGLLRQRGGLRAGRVPRQVHAFQQHRITGFHVLSSLDPAPLPSARLLGPQEPLWPTPALRTCPCQKTRSSDDEPLP